MNLRFRHVGLKVKDLDRSIAFYCDILGFEQGPAFVTPDGRKTGVFVYINHGAFFELIQGEPQESSAHFCLEVDNVREAVRLLREKGVTVSEPSLGRSKAWMAFFKDPDGYALELNEFSPPESWVRRYLSERDPQNGAMA